MRLLDGNDPSARLDAEKTAWRKASELTTRLARRARAASREDPGSFGPATEALFDLVAESDLLPIVAPRGRLPRDFAVKCLAAARQRLSALGSERAALAASERLLGQVRESMARRGEERPRAGAIDPRLRSRLARLAESYPGEPEEGLAPGQLALPGTTLLIEGSGRLRVRATIPGSRIILGPRLLPGRTRLRVAADGHRPGRAGHAGHEETATLGRAHRASDAPRGNERSALPALPEHLSPARTRMRNRLGEALAIVEAAWPQAAQEIRARTRLVLPLDEPGLVSFSLPSRPGVSFINLRGKSLVDLADDLLHETAHHRLHAIEDARPLFRPWKATSSVGTFAGDEEPRFWSPWRSAQRPARGLFHACYTFSFRAELFEGIIRSARASRGRVGALRVSDRIARHLASEAKKERRLVLRSLRELERAEDMGLLTTEGRRLLRIMRTVSSRKGDRGRERKRPRIIESRARNV